VCACVHDACVRACVCVMCACVSIRSTIGVQQSLLEVKKVDLQAGGSGWCVVDDGSSSLMKAVEVCVCVSW